MVRPSVWWTAAQAMTLIGSIACLVVANKYFDMPPRVATFVPPAELAAETRVGTLSREMNGCLVVNGGLQHPGALVAVPVGATVGSRSLTLGSQQIAFGQQVAIKTLHVPLGQAQAEYQARVSAACINFFGVTDTEPLALIVDVAQTP